MKAAIAGVLLDLYDLLLYFCFSTLSNYADDNNLFATGTDIQLINQMLLSDFRALNSGFMKVFCLLARTVMTKMFFIIKTLPMVR